MEMLVWGAVLPACLVAGWLMVRGPLRHYQERRGVELARAQFRRQREWLEARFLGALAKVDPGERLRWEDAHWHDEVLWARDRQTRVFLAMIGVHFDAPEYEEDGDLQPRHSTALFEYRKRRWFAEGKRLDEVRPDEAVLHLHRYEPVVTEHRLEFHTDRR
jgi:hypothetical protein